MTAEFWDGTPNLQFSVGVNWGSSSNPILLANNWTQCTFPSLAAPLLWSPWLSTVPYAGSDAVLSPALHHMGSAGVWENLGFPRARK